jgi:hypothetical protein
MKRYIYEALLLCLSVMLASQEERTISFRKVATFSDLTQQDIYKTFEPGPPPYAWPWVDGEGKWNFILKTEKQRIYSPDLKTNAEKTIDTMPFRAPSGVDIIKNKDFSILMIYRDFADDNDLNNTFTGGAFIINRQGSRYSSTVNRVPGNYFPIMIYDHLLVFRIGTDGFEYTGYLIHDDGSLETYNNNMIKDYIKTRYKGFRAHSDGCFVLNNIELSSATLFDDDGNGINPGGWMAKLTNGEKIVFKNEPGRSSFSFEPDLEGNLWQVYYEGADKHAVLYYAGRDWGYEDLPKDAVVIDDGLRIRLRRSTDAFVLGFLSKGQKITVLKTGEQATIGGITAPWYRIKKADGLIGWAFGGYIKISD